MEKTPRLRKMWFSSPAKLLHHRVPSQLIDLSYAARHCRSQLLSQITPASPYGAAMGDGDATLSQLRLLILTPENLSKAGPSPFPPILQFLTAEAPSEDITSFAGYTNHAPVKLRTKYYEQDVSIWCDELPSISPKPSAQHGAESKETGSSSTEVADEGAVGLEGWKEQMLSVAAKEVRLVIGGIILILPTSTQPQRSEGFIKYIEAAHDLRQAIEDDCPGRDIASVVVLQPQTPASTQVNPSSVLAELGKLAEVLLDECLQNDFFAWDIVHWLGTERHNESSDGQSGQRNEFGEKTGIARVFEVLESVDWSVTPLKDEEVGEDELTDAPRILEGGKASGIDHELQREMLELKLSIMDDQSTTQDGEDDGEDLSMEQMAQLHGRVLAIREAAAGMQGPQKEAFAQREIDKIMREL